MNHAGRTLAALLLALASAGAGADAATVARNTDMRAKPLNDAAVVASLKAQANVEVLERGGAWAQVRSADGKTGWVRLLNLRTSSGQKGDSGVGALASVFRTGSSGSSVSTGVKGLSEEDLTGAKPNADEARKLAALRATDDDARRSAKDAGLKAHNVKYLGDDKVAKKKRDKDAE